MVARQGDDYSARPERNSEYLRAIRRESQSWLSNKGRGLIAPPDRVWYRWHMPKAVSICPRQGNV
jgi:hypothetical protein